MTSSCTWCAEEYKRNQCFGDGEYCLIWPEQGTEQRQNGITERDLLEESLRTRCVHSYLTDEKRYKKNSELTHLFRYIMTVYENCFWQNKFSKECSEGALKEVGLPTSDIN